jgi:hypothetical protein
LLKPNIVKKLEDSPKGTAKVDDADWRKSARPATRLSGKPDE